MTEISHGFIHSFRTRTSRSWSLFGYSVLDVKDGLSWRRNMILVHGDIIGGIAKMYREYIVLGYLIKKIR